MSISVWIAFLRHWRSRLNEIWQKKTILKWFFTCSLRMRVPKTFYVQIFFTECFDYRLRVRSFNIQYKLFKDVSDRLFCVWMVNVKYNPFILFIYKYGTAKRCNSESNLYNLQFISLPYLQLLTWSMNIFVSIKTARFTHSFRSLKKILYTGYLLKMVHDRPLFLLANDGENKNLKWRTTSENDSLDHKVEITL